MIIGNENLPRSSKLDVSKLARVFENTTTIYKYLWLLSILDFVEKDIYEISFNDIVDKMIVKSWYMTLEYHLNIGAESIDKKESILKKIILSAENHLTSTSSEESILDYIKNCDDTKLMKYKENLIKNVPYRFLKPFISVENLFSTYGTGANYKDDIIDAINKADAFYKISKFDSLNTTITIDSTWAQYFKENISVIRYFAKYKMVEFLQIKNPTVPGLIYKIDKPEERRLNDVRAMWSSLIDSNNYVPNVDYALFKKDIYIEEHLDVNDVSIDHFIPFSYIASDEFYNLTPVSKSLNSSKSNYLVNNFDSVCLKLCKQHYEIYKLMRTCDLDFAKEIDKVALKHLNDRDMIDLYHNDCSENNFIDTLIVYLKKQYDNAIRQGFEKWDVA